MATPDPQSWGIFEWMLGAAWVVLTFFAELLRRAFGGVQRRTAALQDRVAGLEGKAGMIDHDLRGVRQNQLDIERTNQDRHKTNQQDTAELREFLTDEMRELRRQNDSMSGRIDRLLERRDGGAPPRR